MEPEPSLILTEVEPEPSLILTEEFKDWGINEKKNINKEKSRNRNQPYAFIGGGDFGEQLTLEIYPETIGSSSKGGCSFDNSTLDENKVRISAKEVKFISLLGTKECVYCNKKAPYFQNICIYCDRNKNKFKYKCDSRASISSKAHIDYKHIINHYIIFVQDFYEKDMIIKIKGYKFLSNNKYFNDYIQNQYNHNKGYANFVPYSIDWYNSGPINILDVSIDISKDEPIVNYHNYNPLTEKYDNIILSKYKQILKNQEEILFDKEIKNITPITPITGNEVCYKYEDICNIICARKKCLGKPRGTTIRK